MALLGDENMNAKYLRKYFIMGSQNCSRDPEVILQEAIAGGITAFQYREKGIGSLTGREKVLLGKKLRSICHVHQIPFFVNDDVELAEILEVDGIHVGQNDTPVEEVRKQFPNLLIGLSVSNTIELAKSPLSTVDYVGAGPVFTTTTKGDAKQAVGTEWIVELRRQQPTLPIVGIGGINTMNAQEVLEAGANGVAFISIITQAEDISAVLEKL